jgi:hypothetical protein
MTTTPSPRRPRREAPGGTRAALLLAALLPLLPAATRPGDDEQDTAAQVEDAKDVLERWVETRRVISQEKRDWALGKEVLEDRIELVQGEIEALRGRISDAQASLAEADEKRADLVAQNERLTAASATLAELLAGFESRTLALLERLPDPIRERVKPLSQRIPEAGAETEQSLSQRFQNVVGILNEVDKFNRDITVTSEVRPLGDGTTAEVTAIYAGLGQGWYVSTNGAAAGIGRSGPDGWQWTPANDAAPRIAEAIAILENEKVAAFVQLPVRLAQEGSSR